MLTRRFTPGDTIIEVMFAFVIFSLVAVGAVMLMNQGVAMAQRSLEITQVREQIDAQVTMVKFMQYNGDDAKWREFLGNNLSDRVPSFDDTTLVTTDANKQPEKTCPTSANLQRAFFLAKENDQSIAPKKVTQTTFEPAINYSTVQYDPGLKKDDNDPNSAAGVKSYGLWAYITRAEGATSAGKTNAYDLYVRACWSSVGTKEPMTIGTVTRLYDVR